MGAIESNGAIESSSTDKAILPFARILARRCPEGAAVGFIQNISMSNWRGKDFGDGPLDFSKYFCILNKSIKSCIKVSAGIARSWRPGAPKRVWDSFPQSLITAYNFSGIFWRGVLVTQCTEIT